MMAMGREIDPAEVVGTREHAEAVTRDRVPSVRNALQWLTFSHLPEKLQVFSRPFYIAAVEIIQATSDTAELTYTLNRLIDAKDWGVRAGIHTDTGRAGSVPRPQTVVSPPVFGETSEGDQPEEGRSAFGLPNHPDFTLPEGNYGAGQYRPRPIRDVPQA